MNKLKINVMNFYLTCLSFKMSVFILLSLTVSVFILLSLSLCLCMTALYHWAHRKSIFDSVQAPADSVHVVCTLVLFFTWLLMTTKYYKETYLNLSYPISYLFRKIIIYLIYISLIVSQRGASVVFHVIRNINVLWR